MCFYHGDYDWYASVVEESDPIAEKATRCHECGEAIAVGEQYHRIYQQEHESCYDCEENDCDCKCEKPNLGESYTYWRCMNCHKFLQAVQKHELDEGCRADESQPSLGGMIEELGEFEVSQLVAYFSVAGRMHPEIQQSGYLERLRKRLVSDEFDDCFAEAQTGASK